MCQAEYGALRGGAAFTALLSHAAPGIIDVSPLRAAPPAEDVVGKLDALLMRELLSGRLNVQTGGEVGGAPESLLGSLDGALARLEHGEGKAQPEPRSAVPAATIRDDAAQPDAAQPSVLKRVRSWFRRG